jgi:hypothetical protein
MASSHLHPAPLVALLGGATLAGAALSAPPPAERIVAGLDAEVRGSWTGLPLRAWAERATALAGRPVILDRRIDPQTPVTFTARGEPLRTVLDRVAAAADAAVDELNATLRIAPPSVAGRAAAGDAMRRRELAALPPALRKRLTAAEPWQWPAGARPRDLVAGLATEAGLDVAGFDAIPHDHFPAADLPPVSLAERFDLVLAHFDYRVAWDGRPGQPAGRIVPLAAAAPALERSPGGADAARPAPRPGERPRRTVKVRDTYTLRLEAPLDQALATVAAQLGLAIDLDLASLVARGIAPGEIVRTEVADASRDELLTAIVEPLGLAWRIEDGRLSVFAPGSDAE